MGGVSDARLAIPAGAASLAAAIKAADTAEVRRRAVLVEAIAALIRCGIAATP